MGIMSIVHLTDILLLLFVLLRFTTANDFLQDLMIFIHCGNI